MKLMKKAKKQEEAELPVKHPKTALAHLRDEIDQAFERACSAFEQGRWPTFGEIAPMLADIAPWPAIDVAEDDKALTLQMDLPGMTADQINVEVSGNLLTVKGERSEEKSEKEGGVRRHERRTGRFSRSTTLPSYVKPEKISARYERGILTITVPKMPGTGARRVQVETA